MWGNKSRLRENERGVGYLAHPAVLAVIFFVVALAVLAVIVPLVVLASVAAIVLLVGALIFGAGAGLRNWYGVLLGIVLIIVGAVLLGFGYAVVFG